MIARYKNGLPPQPACALQAPPRVSDSRLSVFVRCRPLLPEDAKAGGFDVITTEGAEEGAGLVLHEPKTLVDMSKAMDNHHYKFDATFGPASTNAQAPYPLTRTRTPSPNPNPNPNPTPSS